MTRYYYKKTKPGYKKNILRLFSIPIFFFGFCIVFYVFFPLISWQVYFAPIFNAQDVAIPIPKTTVITQNDLGSLVSQASNNLRGVDYTNAKNWFPDFASVTNDTKTPSYVLSIPKLGIKKASVSTTDYDLGKHLVNYPGTALPPKMGNAVIFGHSTLPQLFNNNDYKTIFATLYKLQVGDEIFADIASISYKYKVASITVVDPDDTSLLAQQYDDSYITLITCTPPGTTWKRLVVKTRLEKI